MLPNKCGTVLELCECCSVCVHLAFGSGNQSPITVPPTDQRGPFQAKCHLPSLLHVRASTNRQFVFTCTHLVHCLDTNGRSDVIENLVAVRLHRRLRLLHIQLQEDVLMVSYRVSGFRVGVKERSSLYQHQVLVSHVMQCMTCMFATFLPCTRHPRLGQACTLRNSYGTLWAPFDCEDRCHTLTAALPGCLAAWLPAACLPAAYQLP